MKKEKENILKRSIYIFAFITTLTYIIYRIFFTIPTAGFINVFFAVIVILVEITEAFFFGIHCFNILIYKKTSPPTPKIADKDYPEIDILVATINEEPKLLEDTITAIKNMKYPDKKKLHIYLCDDGRREEMKNLCKKMNINYIVRPDNSDAKAGNYNHALSVTHSPYVVTFDSDMQPCKDFLLKTVPFLIVDKNVGFAQVPQNFRNPDIYQCRYKLIGEIPHEQDYFFDKIQMAKNNINSVIYCGTNTVFLRKALEEVNGFATKSVTEDIATGLLIQARGYKGISIKDKEAFGIAVNNLDSYIKQKIRWGCGCIQTFKNYKVLDNEGLSFRQKMDYLTNIFYWSYGFRQLFSFTVPLLFPLFGIKMIRNNVLVFATLFFIQYIMKRLVVDFAEERAVSSTWTRIYETVLFPIMSVEIFKEVFNIGSHKFEVSPKHKEKNYMSKKNKYLLTVHTIFFVISLIATIISFIKAYYVKIDYYLIPLFWLISNLIYLSFALIFDLSLKEVEDVDVRDQRIERYNTKTYFKIIYNFFKEECNIKTIIASIIILCITAAGSIGIISLQNKTNNPNEAQIQQKRTKEPDFVSKNGWLRIEEDKIVNEDGKQVMLRGINSHHLIGYHQFYNYDNLKNLKENWGVNVFRIALFITPKEEGYIKNKYLKDYLEEIVQNCIKLDMYVIIDWHILHESNPQLYEKEAIKFFDEMSKKYAEVPNVLYEICNEPNGKKITWKKVIKPYAEKLIKTIRTNSPNSIIIVGTEDYSKSIAPVIEDPLEHKNIIYAIHTYMGEDTRITTNSIELAIQHKIPIFVTECGATDGSGDGYLYLEPFKIWIKSLEEKNISWAVWQLSDKDESSSILTTVEKRQLKWMTEKIYTEEEIKNKKYDINDYLTEYGETIRELFYKYSLGIKE